MSESILSGKEQFDHEYYMADGGFETTLIYHQGITLNNFAAFELLNDEAGREALKSYYLPYLQLAQQVDVGFILETPTWRCNPDWGFKMGYSREDLDQINRFAVRFLKQMVGELPFEVKGLLISGCVGPRGDGYVAGEQMTERAAALYHAPQVSAFSEQGVDLVTAMTLTYPEEATGLVNAARENQVPVVISFTLETDGRLPCGVSLRDAIEEVDDKTGHYVSHYMINCAHPHHFLPILEEKGNWKNRIRGLRANASEKSHAELDKMESLDEGNCHLLAKDYLRVRELLPELMVMGGCCGTDHRHMEEIFRLLKNQPDSTPV